MGSIYHQKLKIGKPSSRYWVKYYVNGRAVRESTKTDEREAAKRFLTMKLTGHKTESVYRRYAIVSDADLREATQRLLGTFPGTLGAARVDGRAVTVQNDEREALAQPGRAPAF